MAMSIRFTTQTFLGLKFDERQMFLNHLIRNLQHEDLCCLFTYLRQRVKESIDTESKYPVSMEASEEKDETVIVNVDPSIDNALIEAFLSLMASKRQPFLKSLILKMEIGDVKTVFKKVINKIADTESGVHVELHDSTLVLMKEDLADDDLKQECIDGVHVHDSTLDLVKEELEEDDIKQECIDGVHVHDSTLDAIKEESKDEYMKPETAENVIIKTEPSLVEFDENKKNSDTFTEEFYSYSSFDPKDLRCKKCDKSFLSRHRLTEHIKYHIKLNLMCEHCSKICPTRQQLKYHLKTHLELAPHKCDYCGRGFINKNNLTKHIRTHTKEKPYKCDECDKKFPQVVGLNIHKNIHQGKRPFGCEHCNKAFFDKSALTKHGRTHTGEKPYPCKKCNTSFATSTHLKTHMKSLKCSGSGN